MKTINIITSLIFGVLLFTACEKEVDFNGKVTDPLVVVNSYITSDSIVSANISESKFFLYNKEKITGTSNAEVSVYVNGVFKEKMTYLSKGNYKGTYQPKTGDVIKLVVKVPGRNEVNCEQTVLAKVDFTIDTTSVAGKSSYYTGTDYTTGKTDTMSIYSEIKYRYKIKIIDKEEEKNYYRIVISRKENQQSIINFYKIYLENDVDPASYSTDPLASDGSVNEYNVFSDDFFNGKEIAIKCNFMENVTVYSKYIEVKIKRDYIITLQQISKDLYLYLKTRSASGGDDFLSEPVQVHNNIIGGLGVLGSYASVVKVIEIK